MQSLASQSSTASTVSVEAMSVAPMATAIRNAEIGTSANDNQAAWKPSLLVLRRRRQARRAIRS